jgi:glutamate synthase domain-containing protein 3
VGAQDIATLRDLVARHRELTGSPRARWILENWSEALPQFIKVFPHEYKRVLGVPRVAREDAPVLVAAAGAPHISSVEQVQHG